MCVYVRVWAEAHLFASWQSFWGTVHPKNNIFEELLLETLNPIDFLCKYIFEGPVDCIYIYIYIQTRFQKSWDTVQIVNKKRMQ